MKSRFRRQGIQAHVPGFGETRISALAVEGQPDQVRTVPAAPPTAEVERSIVESSAHAQAAALRVYSDQGYDDEIQPSGCNGACHPLRDRDPERTPVRPAVEGVEPQSAVTAITDNRYVYAHTAAARSADQRSGVRLPVKGQINRDAFAGREHRPAGNRLGGRLRAEPVIGGTQGAPPGA